MPVDSARPIVWHACRSLHEARTAPRARSNARSAPVLRWCACLTAPALVRGAYTRLVIVYRIQRVKLLKEAVLFMAAVGLFVAVMLSIAVVGTAWDQTNGVKDLLFDEEFPGAQQDHATLPSLGAPLPPLAHTPTRSAGQRSPDLRNHELW